MFRSNIILRLSFCGVIAGCGGDGNLADCKTGSPTIPCSQRTPEEEARLALELGDFDQAIALLTQLIDENPEDYALYTLLSAAHAARAKVAVIDLAMNSLVGRGSLIEQVGSFLPQPSEVGNDVYADYLQDMQRAVSYLKSIPADLRGVTSSEKYAKSAQIQLGIYSVAYSIMHLNQFVATTDMGRLDASKLATMTEADAAIVIASLTEAASLQAAAGSTTAAQNINTTLTQIASQPGATQSERLQNYVTATRATSS